MPSFLICIHGGSGIKVDMDQLDVFSGALVDIADDSTFLYALRASEIESCNLKSAEI